MTSCERMQRALSLAPGTVDELRHRVLLEEFAARRALSKLVASGKVRKGYGDKPVRGKRPIIYSRATHQ